MPLRVVLTAPSLGLGGTEKSMVTHALHLDRTRFDVSVVGVLDGGERERELQEHGIPVTVTHGDPTRLAVALRGADVVHVNRGGSADPLVPSAARAAGVGALVETNVFGHLDTSADEAAFACHLFISQMCALRYRELVGMEPAPFLERHRVSYYPVDARRLSTLAPSAGEARTALGLDPARPVVSRIGRADDRKWSPLVVDMLPHLLRAVPEVQVVLVGATPAVRRRLDRAGVLHRVRLIEPTSDEVTLARLYAASDVLAMASSIGESFGLAIAEAMAMGVPVVTNSTPWTDNAQVEVIDPGVSGFLASHPRAFAEAVTQLLSDRLLHDRFAAAARQKAEVWSPHALTRQLEALYASVHDTGRPPAEWHPDAADSLTFPAEYARRQVSEFRPLTPGEHRQVRAARLRERAGWFLSDWRDGSPDQRRTLALTAFRAAWRAFTGLASRRLGGGVSGLPGRAPRG